MSDLKHLPDSEAPHGARCVSDLRSLIGDGQARTFKKTCEPAGDEPAFYELRQPGEYEWEPLWINPPDIRNMPRPAMLDWPALSLESHGDFEFQFDTSRSALGAFYNKGGIYIVHDALVELARAAAPNSFETHPLRMRSPSGEPIPGFQMVMSTLVLEAVDISKTDVTVFRPESPPGHGRFITHTRYASGYVISNAVANNPCFIDRFSSYWLWRRDLVERIASTGVLGLDCVHTFKRSFLDRVRFIDSALDDQD